MIVGIDLGTTNSAIAVWRDGAADLIANRLGYRLTPSAVSLADDGSLLVGLPARERLATHPDRTATAFKRYMGSQRKVRLGGQDYLPEELSAMVLQRLKGDAEVALGEAVTEAVITVPAYFNDKQRKATRRAGELAGLKVERLINEPTAAALAYGIHQLDDESRYLVFDLGGGTFDVSIVEIFEGIIEVRSSTGDNMLGGEDFNEVLVGIARERFGAEWGDAAKGEGPLVYKLREAAERTRRALTEGDSDLRLVWQDREWDMPVAQAAFEEAVQPLIDRLREPVVRAVRDAGLAPEALDEIILIGGATRMPVVRRAVTRLFGRFPNATVNPDEAVALGAAIQAGLKSRDADLKEVVVTDVCPYSLGIEVAREGLGNQVETGFFQPVIERSTVIPASRVHNFQTMRDSQKQVDVNIYQGESRRVSDNVLIGSVTVPVPRAKAGHPFDVRFSYDVSGLLEVDILVHGSNHREQLVIQDGDARDADAVEQSRQRLAALKVHPADQEENRAAVARGERCFENFLGQRRDYVAMLLDRFQAALATQDPRITEQARTELHAELDEIEGGTFL